MHVSTRTGGGRDASKHLLLLAEGESDALHERGALRGGEQNPFQHEPAHHWGHDAAEEGRRHHGRRGRVGVVQRGRSGVGGKASPVHCRRANPAMASAHARPFAPPLRHCPPIRGCAAMPRFCLDYAAPGAIASGRGAGLRYMGPAPAVVPCGLPLLWRTPGPQTYFSVVR